MSEEQEQEIRAAERDRLGKIEAACKGVRDEFIGDLKTKTINEEISLEQLQAALLEAGGQQGELDIMRQRRPRLALSISEPADVSTGDVITAALLNRPGYAAVAEKQIGAARGNRCWDDADIRRNSGRMQGRRSRSACGCTERPY